MNNKHPQIVRIGLLAPYNGSNLGDGAIQEAVIQNIRKRIPDAEIFGFTTCPEKTEYLHSIQCFPMTAIYIPGYSNTILNRIRETKAKSSKASSTLQRAKDRIKQIKYFYFPLKRFYSLFMGIPLPFRELRHIVIMYRRLRNFDLLVVSGGGQLDDYWGGPMGHPYSLFKWSLIAKLTNTRFVFLSVGMCSLKSKLSQFFIKNALKRSDYRSYRDNTSKELLKKYDFTQNDHVYPDLAFSYNSYQHQKSLNESKPSTGQRVIGISPIAYLSKYGWPETNPFIFEQYISKLVEFIKLLQQRNYAIMVFSTDRPDDHVIKEVINKLSENSGYNLYTSIREVYSEKPNDHFSQSMTIDCVIASRLHGIIFSHLAEKPALAVSYDRKVNTYMAESDQAEYCIDIHNFDLNLLLEKFDSLILNAEDIKACIRKNNKNNKILLDQQYNQILA